MNTQIDEFLKDVVPVESTIEKDILPELIEVLQFSENMLDYKHDRNELTTDDLRVLRSIKLAIEKLKTYI